MKYAALIHNGRYHGWYEIPGWFYEELKQNRAGLLKRGTAISLLPSITCLLTIK